jgi:hypothetical protein
MRVYVPGHPSTYVPCADAHILFVYASYTLASYTVPKEVAAAASKEVAAAASSGGRVIVMQVAGPAGMLLLLLLLPIMSLMMTKMSLLLGSSADCQQVMPSIPALHHQGKGWAVRSLTGHHHHDADGTAAAVHTPAK